MCPSPLAHNKKLDDPNKDKKLDDPNKDAFTCTLTADQAERKVRVFHLWSSPTH